MVLFGGVVVVVGTFVLVLLLVFMLPWLVFIAVDGLVLQFVCLVSL